jgi:uncharacterized repeat protein (TIGR03803 family)
MGARTEVPVKHLLPVTLVIFVTLAIAGSAAAAGPHEAVIYNFQGGSDGSYPYGGLVAGPHGVFYGTTTEGGGGTCAGGCGTVFQLAPSSTSGSGWAETVLYRFTGGSDGATPWASLIFDVAGNLYGSPLFGGEACGCGVVFKLARPTTAGGSWTQSVLYSFKGVHAGDGDGPEGALVFDQSGNLYGATYSGGIPCSDSAPTGCGTVFQLSPPAAIPSGSGGAWTESLIYRFDPSFNGAPSAGLIIDSQGSLYGTAVNDGPYGEGTAYKLSPGSAGAWERTVLHAFGGASTDGGYVWAGLTPTGGALYGATVGYGGEVGDGGTVFQLTPPASPGGAWTETVLYVFPGENGDTRGPFGGLVTGPTGTLFGMTPSGGGGSGSCQVGGWLGCGTVFQLNPPASPGGSWTHTTLHSFAGAPEDGSIPYGSLIFGPGNALFGTTYGGGSGTCSQPSPTGCGTAFVIVP